MSELTKLTKTSKRKAVPKPRVHREWFRTVELGGRKSCPTCGTRLEPGESIWSWGEYVRAKWRTITHFCKQDWEDRLHEGAHPQFGQYSYVQKGIKSELLQHAGGCGCEFELVGYQGQKLPEWMTLGKEVCDATSKV